MTAPAPVLPPPVAGPSIAIPGRLNLLIGTASIITGIAMLWVASHATHWMVLVAAAVAFSYVNNTSFSLLHEAVHGVFHRHRRVNDAAGVVLAAMFPTGFRLQRASHLGHHRRNRTDLELFDYYLPHESRWVKTYWLYCLLTGFYWAIIPVAGAAYLLMPWAFSRRWLQRGPARWWGFEPLARDIGDEPRGRVWLELLWTVLFQALVWFALGLTWTGWLACYWAFGINWGSLQYTDHAWTVRDVREGASNLQVNPVVRAIFLNYHCHLVHHRWPHLPWLHLPRFVSAGDPQPAFWRVYLSLWGGARPAPPGAGPAPLPAPPPGPAPAGA